VLYFCQANTEAEAQSIHKRVWNQGIVPSILVQPPVYLRLYSGFRYKHVSPSETETEGILQASIAFNDVANQLAAFQAHAIDNGTRWQAWGDTITPQTRVDWTLLENLKNLDRYLQECAVSLNVIGNITQFFADGLTECHSASPGLCQRRRAGGRLPGAPAQRITSFASKRREEGRVRSRARAVLRLMTSSNAMGCSTGISAGLAPFRSRST
jgi:hypothetical protein